MKIILPALLPPLVIFLCNGSIANGFSPPAIVGAVRANGQLQSPSAAASRSSTTTTTQLNLVDHDLALEMAAARGAFGLCFYGALGVGSIGRELIPIVFGRYDSNQKTSALSSKNARTEQKKEKTEDLGIRGYPEPIFYEDVAPILANRMDALTIAQKFDERKEGDLFRYTHIEDRTPFLTFDSYRRANPNADPMALRAVFDSFSDSIGGGNVISPITAQERIEQYREDVTMMAKRLNRSKVLGVTAFAFVLVLLGFADYLTIYHLWRGFFPEWQGFADMPGSLFDGETGMGVLPQYFIGDIPDV